MNEENKAPHGSLAGDLHLAELSRLWKKYGTHVLSAVLAVLVIVMGVRAFVSHRTQAKTRAMEMFFTAGSLQQLEEITRSYPSSPAAPLAMLELASRHFDAGNYGQARLMYENFLENHAEHELRKAAELGRYFCMEAEGRINEALFGFSGYIAANPEDFMTPQAVQAKGRCLQVLGRMDEARILYEDFMTAHPESEWVPQMESALALVEREMRQAARPAPPPAVPDEAGTAVVEDETPELAEDAGVRDDAPAAEPVSDPPAADEQSVQIEPEPQDDGPDLEAE